MASKAGLRYVMALWHPPNLERQNEIDQNRDLKAAYEWAGAYVPSRNGVIYDAILKFAEDSYKDTVRVSDDLDKKADDLMKVAGAIGAALAAAGRITGMSLTLTSRPIILAIGCLVLTMLICARARKPVKKLVPLTIRALMEVAETSGLPYTPDEDADSEEEPVHSSIWSPPPARVTPTLAQVKATIAASYHWAVAGTQFVIEWKARLITIATFVFCLGLTLLVLGLLNPFQ